MTGRGGLDGRGEAGGDQVLGTMGIGFQGSRLGSLPEWGEGDGSTRVIRVAIYAKSWRPLFVLFDQIGSMHGVSGFPCVITWSIAFPPDQELELLVPAEVPVTADRLHLVFFFSADKVRWWPGEVWAV